MESILFLLILLLLGAVFYAITKVVDLDKKIAENSAKKENNEANLKSDILELSRNVSSLNNSVSKTIQDSNNTMISSISKSQSLIAEISKEMSKFSETGKHVGSIANELKTLQTVLSMPKQRGVFGEYYLETVLSNTFTPGQYQLQYKFSDGQIVDAVVFLDKGRILPIDSKFTLENYNRMIESGTKEEKEKLHKLTIDDLKKRINETAKYIKPSENTMNFAFMFIPSEALYYDLLIGKVGTASSSQDLISYAYNEKHVIVVSPTSLMAYLQTVMQGLRSLEIEKNAKDIQKRVGELGRHLDKYDEYMVKLGKTLGTTVSHFNNAQKEYIKVDKDIVKISGGETSVEALAIDKPQEIE